MAITCQRRFQTLMLIAAGASMLLLVANRLQASQPFRLLSTETSSGWWEVRFEGPHKLYQMESSDDLKHWQSIAQFWPVGTNYSIVVPLAGDKQFFRAHRISPLHDDFSERFRLPGSIIETNGSVYGATLEPAERNPAQDDGSIWYEWTAPADGVASLSIDYTNFNPTMELDVYRGTCLANLNPFSAGLVSSLTFWASNQTVYQLSVRGRSTIPDNLQLRFTFSIPPTVSLLQPMDGARLFAPGPIPFVADAHDPDGFISQVEFVTAGGAIHKTITNAPWSLDVTNFPAGFFSIHAIATDNLGVQSETDYVNFTVAPPNDDFDRRAPLTGTNLTFRGSNVGSSREADEPIHHNVFGTNSVWWSWTAPSSGPVTISTIATGVYDILAVYTGEALSSLVEIGSAVASAGSTSAVVNFNAVQGTEYQIVIDSRAFTGSVTTGSVRGAIQMH